MPQNDKNIYTTIPGAQSIKEELTITKEYPIVAEDPTLLYTDVTIDLPKPKSPLDSIYLDESEIDDILLNTVKPYLNNPIYDGDSDNTSLDADSFNEKEPQESHGTKDQSSNIPNQLKEKSTEEAHNVASNIERGENGKKKGLLNMLNKLFNRFKRPNEKIAPTNPLNNNTVDCNSVLSGASHLDLDEVFDAPLKQQLTILDATKINLNDPKIQEMIEKVGMVRF